MDNMEIEDASEIKECSENVNLRILEENTGGATFRVKEKLEEFPVVSYKENGTEGTSEFVDDKNFDVGNRAAKELELLSSRSVDEESSSKEHNLTNEQLLQVLETDNVSDEAKDVVSNTNSCRYLFEDYSTGTRLICKAWKEFRRKGNDSCLKGCKWSPDGSCLLTNYDDKKLAIFDLPSELYTQKSWPKNQTTLLPDLKKTVQVEEGARVYDYCWYPPMNSWDLPSCCFVSSATDEPVHLWDAFNGKLRATYQSHNYADETITPFSLNFSPDGEKLFCGFKNRVDIFNVVCPGKKPTSFNIKGLSDQPGLVSAIAVNPAFQDLFAVGTFQKTVGLYSVADKCGICVFSGHSGGLTHIMFSSDGSRLYTGARMDPEIVCWDLRNPGKVLFSVYRNMTTNQRIYFDLTSNGKFLVSGNTNGSISIWNLDNDKNMNGDIEPLEPDIVFQAHKDCSNGVSINKQYPILATASGQRHFPDLESGSEDGSDSNSGDIFDFDSVKNKRENCIKLWWVGPVN